MSKHLDYINYYDFTQYLNTDNFDYIYITTILNKIPFTGNVNRCKIICVIKFHFFFIF